VTREFTIPVAGEGEIRAVVQERQVDEIDIAFVPLQPVAVVEQLDREHLLVRQRQELIVGKERRLARAHVRLDHARPLDAWIRRVPDPFTKRAARRFAGLFEAAAARVVQPTMVDAAQAAVFDAAVAQIGAAMGAMQPDQAGLAALVAEEDKVFAEDAHGDRPPARRHLLGERRGVPVPPQEIATLSSRIGVSQDVVFAVAPAVHQTAHLLV
jgi:hypothetical protein